LHNYKKKLLLQNFNNDEMNRDDKDNIASSTGDSNLSSPRVEEDNDVNEDEGTEDIYS
jgi:hypothetical protein